MSDAVLAIVWNKNSSNGKSECCFELDHLKKIAKVSKLKKSITKDYYFIDVSESAACTKVFEWVGRQIQAKVKKAKKKAREEEF